METVVGGEESIRNSIDEEHEEERKDGEPETPGKISHQEFWALFTGLKLKEFTRQEMEAFKKPFDMGWRREVVLRGTVSRDGKKVGDVYYFGPDKKVKLRSYVEMGLFLRKNMGCGLEPENFTFARQPIYEPPLEIIRHAMTRGANQTNEPTIIQATTPLVSPTKTTTLTEVGSSPAKEGTTTPAATRRSLSTTSSVEEPEIYTGGIAEGRAKRKRVAPTRFEDEDYNEQSPFKRKTVEKPKTPLVQSPLVSKASPVSGGGKTGVVIKINRKPSGGPIPSVIENKANIIVTGVSKPSQIIIKTATPILPKPQQTVRPMASNSPIVSNPRVNALSLETKPTVNALVSPNRSMHASPANGHSKVIPQVQVNVNVQPKIVQKVVTMNGNVKPHPQPQQQVVKAIKPKPSPAPIQSVSQRSSIEETVSLEPTADDGMMEEDGKVMVPPCSIICGGGQVPSLLCFRCLCLFHDSCVPNGLILSTQQFLCPNCIQPNDKGRKVGTDLNKTNGDHKASQLQQHRPTTSLLQTQLMKNRPILPKPNNAGSSTLMMRQKQKSHLELLQQFQEQTSGNFLASQQKETSMARLQKNRPSITGSQHHALKERLEPRIRHEFVARSGHHTIKCPMMGRPGDRSQVRSSGLMSRGQHQQMSKIIQNQLQNLQPSSYQPAPIAPIAPIKVTPAQVASYLDKITDNKYKEYMNKIWSPMNGFLSGFSILSNCLEFLDVNDLKNLRLVNRSFERLVSQSDVWKNRQPTSFDSN